ncbi:hypothetical protein [Isoptericola variabilis]|uniref:hypothetical protein n=1 Tax=Isoptericola variabilis TaxID=139208 RepID=UPI00031BC752|nr:hypothetical protein [Isoptericola variabilis]TWH30943.1 hypothetical protein L600_002800000080 [Isoptericola variabilis J7]
MSEQSPSERPDGGTPVDGASSPARPDASGRRRRGPRRAVRRGTEREPVLGVSADERGGHGSNDERLERDVPPHW